MLRKKDSIMSPVRSGVLKRLSGSGMATRKNAGYPKRYRVQALDRG